LTAIPVAGVLFSARRAHVIELLGKTAHHVLPDDARGEKGLENELRDAWRGWSASLHDLFGTRRDQDRLESLPEIHERLSRCDGSSDPCRRDAKAAPPIPSRT
jgi:hypothetical protein